MQNIWVLQCSKCFIQTVPAHCIFLKMPRVSLTAASCVTQRDFINTRWIYIYTYKGCPILIRSPSLRATIHEDLRKLHLYEWRMFLKIVYIYKHTCARARAERHLEGERLHLFLEQICTKKKKRKKTSILAQYSEP